MKEETMAPAVTGAPPHPSIDTPPRDRAPVLWLLSVVLLLLALVALPPLANTRADDIREQTAQAQRFADTLASLESDLQQMQAAARGFLITQNPTFREQYRALQDGLPLRLQDLTGLAPLVDPSLEAQMTDLSGAVARWQREGADRQLDLAAQGRPSDAAAELATGTSQAIFDAIRTRIGEIRQRTQANQGELSMQLARARSAQLALTVGLGMAGLVAAGFVVAGFRRQGRLSAENGRLFAAAQTERQRLQTIFDHSPAGIVVVDAPHGRVVMINPAARELLGDLTATTATSQQSFAGRVYLPGGRSCPPEELPLARALREGSSQPNREYVVEIPGGERVPVLITSVPLLSANGVLRGAVGVIQDLRHLREVERLKSDFVALVSHELRTPLAAIKGAAETLLRRGTPTDPQRWREYLELIDGQSDRLNELIDNLLSLSQVEAGALRLRRDLMALLPLVQGLLREHGERLGAARVQVEIPGGLPLLSADPRRIEQVLLNLLENAQKFSPPGRLIRLQAERQGREVVIAVSDEGPGVPAAERERVFERFYQIARPHTRNVGGSGLGLAICKALVEAHGGRIWVDAAPGGGARFAFVLPALPNEEDEAPPASELLARSAGAAARVLLVDDDPALRRILERGLSDAGYAVESVIEPQAALEAITRRPPDLVLLDVMLPGMDGFTFCTQLREWTSVPIIMLTARGAELDIMRGLQLGADDYVTKPFRMGELLARMQAVLRRAEGPALGEATVFCTGQLRIDLTTREVRRGDDQVTLTPTEYGILAVLARHLGQVLSHEQILRAVWGEHYGGESQYLWVHVGHLRQKLEPNPSSRATSSPSAAWATGWRSWRRRRERPRSADHDGCGAGSKHRHPAARRLAEAPGHPAAAGGWRAARTRSAGPGDQRCPRSGAAGAHPANGGGDCLRGRDGARPGLPAAGRPGGAQPDHRSGHPGDESPGRLGDGAGQPAAPAEHAAAAERPRRRQGGARGAAAERGDGGQGAEGNQAGRRRAGGNGPPRGAAVRPPRRDRAACRRSADVDRCPGRCGGGSGAL